MAAMTPGQVVLDLGPETGYARHSEGAFTTLLDGTVLFIWSRFDPGSYLDHAGASLVESRSSDGGVTWSDPVVIIDRSDEGAQNVMSVSLLRLQDGRLALWYLRRQGYDDLRAMMRISTDDGNSWGEPQCCIPGLGYHVTNNDRVIQLASGRLVVPAAHHRALDGPDGARFSPWGATYFSLSDDGGLSWQESGPLVLPYPSSRHGLQEPGVVELVDGRLWAWARTDQGTQWEMWSTDSGTTWSAPQPSAFASPRSPLSMKRLTDDRLMAVWNPLPSGPGAPKPLQGWSDGRTPLVLSIGDPAGSEWSTQLVVEDDPQSGYCYTAIHELPDAYLLAYCAGSAVRDRNCLTRLRVRRLPKSQIG